MSGHFSKVVVVVLVEWENYRMSLGFCIQLIQNIQYIGWLKAFPGIGIWH